MKWERRNYKNNTIFIYNKGKITKKNCLSVYEKILKTLNVVLSPFLACSNFVL